MKKYIIFLFGLFLILGGCSKEISINSISKEISTYSMELSLSSDKILTGTETVEYKNTSEDSLSYICFHLYPTAFSEEAINSPISALHYNSAYYNGSDYGDIVINSVFIDDNTTIPRYEGEDDNILILDLEKDLSPNKEVKIEISFTVDIPNVNHRFGYGEHTINLANFYPIAAVYEDGKFIYNPYNSNGDPFYSDMGNYNVTIKIPSSLTLASTGIIDGTSQNDSETTYSISSKAVRDFAMVLSDEFQTIENHTNGTRIIYYYYNDDTPAESLQASVDSINTFDELYGEYPYSTLSVVQTNFVHGGMEFPNLVYISDTVTDKASYINVIIHEISHQWWYQLVGSDAFSYPWLDEALAEYSTILFYEQNPQYGVSSDDIIQTTINNYVAFVELYEEVIGDIDESMNRPLNQYSSETEYVYMTYVKGCILIDNLRNTVGDKKFFKSIQSYFNNYKFTNAKPEDFIGTFEKICHSDLSGFFDSWLNGKVIIKKVA